MLLIRRLWRYWKMSRKWLAYTRTYIGLPHLISNLLAKVFFFRGRMRWYLLLPFFPPDHDEGVAKWMLRVRRRKEGWGWSVCVYLAGGGKEERRFFVAVVYFYYFFCCSLRGATDSSPNKWEMHKKRSPVLKIKTCPSAVGTLLVNRGGHEFRHFHTHSQAEK